MVNSVVVCFADCLFMVVVLVCLLLCLFMVVGWLFGLCLAVVG